MIVVAIIGILAAVAIPGFMSYIKSSKTSEAKTNLDAIRKGAVSYFESEHYSEDGMSAQSKQYPKKGSNAKSTIGQAVSANTVGIKQAPSSVATELTKEPWKSLNFVLASPFYYTYSYMADGNNVVCTTKDGVETCAIPTGQPAQFSQSHFEAIACASLNVEKDSVFSIGGDADGNVSAVRERTASECENPSLE